MSWSPSPYDERVIENLNYQETNFSDMSETERGNALRSQLPSTQVMQNGGGTAVTKKKKSKKKRRSAEAKLDDISAESRSRPASARVAPLEVSSRHDDTSEDDYDFDTLKELIFSMAKKKEIRARLKENSDKAVKSRWKKEGSLKWKRFKEDFRELLRRTQLWRSSIHEIEGRFGSGIRSYFAFLRWLFLLNIYIFTLVFFFICLPTIIFENTESITTSTNSSDVCAYNPYNSTEVQSFSQYIIWWFTGQGFMEDTLLFYGYYTNNTSVLPTTTFNYNIPLAYILIAFTYIFISLALLVKRAAVGVKESLMSGEIRFFTYCNKVFGGWDFCITDENAAVLKHNSIKNELETDMEEERIRRKQAERTTKQKAILYTKRALINIFVLLVLAGSLAGIYFAAEFALQNSNTYDNDFFLDLLVTYLVSIVITFANFVAPLLFQLLIPYEDYSPAFAIQFTLVRTVVLRLVSVMFLYIVVYFQINCENYGFIQTNDTNNCGYCDGMPCWETYMGQEMYKLTILDFFIVLGVTLLVEFPRRLIVKHCSCGLAKTIGYQEFNIPENVLAVVYSQTVMWIGAFYAPLLPVIVVIKFFVFFYLKKLTVMHNCKPASRPYRASRSGTFFFIVLLFGFVVAVIPVGVSLAIIEPSRYCGPFREVPTMFATVTNVISTFPDWLAGIFWFVGSAGFAVIVGVILCLVLYYYVALGDAHKKMIALLKEQLMLEGKDKQYLLKRVNDLQLRMTGVGSAGDGYRKKRTAEVAMKRSTVFFENDDAQSQNSLPGQAYE